MTLFSPFILGPAIILLAACTLGGPAREGLAARGANPATGQEEAPVKEAPVTLADRCSIRIEAINGAVAISGRIDPGAAVAGEYHLRITGRGNRIEQSGGFTLAQGRPGTLGQATLSGGPSDYDVQLTLRSGEDSLTCSSS